jgi:hypothetical protein
VNTEIKETKFEVIVAGRSTTYHTESIARAVFDWAKQDDKRRNVRLLRLTTTAEDISEPEPNQEEQ